MQQDVRKAAVAGRFYPAEPDALSQMVDGFLAAAHSHGRAPKALIAPHAGFEYSGPIAGSAFRCLEPARGSIRRVVLAGPTHWIPFRGIAVSSARRFATPLGEVPVDEDAQATILGMPGVVAFDPAHTQEHSLETHLPFLQRTLENFSIIPLVTGDVSAAEIAAVFDALWGGPETLIVVSSDLSHYLAYEDARRLDTATSQAIASLAPERIRPDQACGRLPVQGLLHCAKKHGLKAVTLDQRNSGDTAGPRNEVVGYGAYAFF